MAFDIDKIESKIDHVVTGSIELSDEGSGIAIKRLVDAMEVAKMMAISKQAVPSFMRGEPGLCYAAVVRAVRWGMDPFFVAEMSYLVNNKGEEKIAFMAQLINAVILARAPIKERLEHEIIGEGEAIKCRVWGTFKGESKPKEHLSKTLAELRPAKNEYGKTKGSPLWDRKPEVQMFYDTSRDWARIYCPDILAGAYSVDEFEPVEPKDVTPERQSLKDRLKSQKRIASPRGFDAAHVDAVIANTAAAAGGDVGSVPVAPEPVAAAPSDAQQLPPQSDGAVPEQATT
jgi:hypothetical protein